MRATGLNLVTALARASLATAAACCVLAACGTAGVIAADGPSPSGGVASLQTPPYGADGAATKPPITIPAAKPSTPPSGEDAGASFEAIASQFDPGRQHFVWVLPPGIHGKGPWDLAAVITHRGEKTFETTIPLKAERVTPGSRPEYPAGYEIVRLTDDGHWTERTAQIDREIQALIAKHGRGNGALEMTNELNVTIDPSHQKAYCVDKQQPDVRFFIEEDGAPELIRLDVAAMATIVGIAVRNACEN